MIIIDKLTFFGDPILRTVSKEVDIYRTDIDSIMNEMIEIINIYGGVGVSAPQIGKPLRMFLIDVNENGKNIFNLVINPEILYFIGYDIDIVEGCLSIPNAFYNVSRPEGVCVKYKEKNGKTVIEEMYGMQSRVFQHEYDHLDGILFVDRVKIGEMYE